MVRRNPLNTLDNEGSEAQYVALQTGKSVNHQS
jgi:hypothetical protein